jgi:hypothetical protein
MKRLTLSGLLAFSLLIGNFVVASVVASSVFEGKSRDKQ